MWQEESTVFTLNVCHPNVFLNIHKVQIFAVKHIPFIVYIECVFYTCKLNK